MSKNWADVWLTISWTDPTLYVFNIIVMIPNYTAHYVLLGVAKREICRFPVRNQYESSTLRALPSGQAATSPVERSRVGKAHGYLAISRE